LLKRQSEALKTEGLMV
jgi:DNA-binding protein H-NS